MYNQKGVRPEGVLDFTVMYMRLVDLDFVHFGVALLVTLNFNSG